MRRASVLPKCLTASPSLHQTPEPWRPLSTLPGSPCPLAQQPDDRVLSLEPLNGPLGCAVHGIDVRAGLARGELRALCDALYEHRLIVLKDQRCTEDEYNAFGRLWGEPITHIFGDDRVPGHAALLTIGNTGEHQRDALIRNSSAYWHTDHAYQAEVATATMLYALKVPDIGGETRFADQKAAYDELDSATRRRIDGLKAVHSYAATAGRDGEHACAPLSEEQAALAPPVRHRLVRRHSVTGARALYAVAGTAFAIEGLPDEEAQVLIAQLKAHATKEKFVYEHRYEVGDIAIWDTQATLHCGKPIGAPSGPGTERVLWRICVRGKPACHR